MSLNLVHLGSKTTSLAQIKEIRCGRSKGYISWSIDLKISQNVCLDKSLDQFEFGSRRGLKISSLGQMKEIPCWRLRGHISCSIDFNIGQNICLDETLYEFESPGVEN